MLRLSAVHRAIQKLKQNQVRSTKKGYIMAIHPSWVLFLKGFRWRDCTEHFKEMQEQLHHGEIFGKESIRRAKARRKGPTP